jgi:hypothetical protein
MHHRFLSWVFFCALFAGVALCAQAPTVTGGSELIFVAKKTGTVKMTLNGAVTDLEKGAKVPQQAKINTLADSSAVLVFSNGATTQLGADTELVIEEYLQNPFTETVKVAAIQDEPSASKTRLSLNRGELVGNVKKLNYDKGSEFTITTPVGAAGIRGTTFRIVYRPTTNGQAFFNLSTSVGNVAFLQPGAPTAPVLGGPPQGTPVTTGNEIILNNVPVGVGPQGSPNVVPIAPGTQIIVSNANSNMGSAVESAQFVPGSSSGGVNTGTVGTLGGAPVAGQNFAPQAINNPSVTPDAVNNTTPPVATPPRIIPTNPDR